MLGQPAIIPALDLGAWTIAKITSVVALMISMEDMVAVLIQERHHRLQIGRQAMDEATLGISSMLNRQLAQIAVLVGRVSSMTLNQTTNGALHHRIVAVPGVLPAEN